MEASIKLGRVFGIPIGLHYSWLILAALITFSLAAQFAATQADWSRVVVWTTAGVTALLFFASILLHELAHAVVAKAYGVPVRSIVLFALGGIAQIDRDATSPKAEFWIAIAGPITSVALGGLCLAAAGALGWGAGGSSRTVAAILGWLGSINVLLALFNLIPGYPLDGGRLLRALLWARSGDRDRATRQAATVGQVVAFSFIVVGLFRFLGGVDAGGLWMAFIGWFLLEAARASSQQVSLEQALRDVRVDEVMARDCATVDANWDVQRFVDQVLLRSGRRCFVVRKGDEVVGLITPADLGQVEREAWPGTRVSSVMRTFDTLRTVSPATPASEALNIMGREDFHQLPVLSNGHLEGVVTRGHLLQLIQQRASLNP